MARVLSGAGRTPGSNGATSTRPMVTAVIPYLVVPDGEVAIRFYEVAFDATESVKALTHDGRVLHATLRFGKAKVMLGAEFPHSEAKAPTTAGATTVTMHIYTSDVDSLWERAVRAGARIVTPLEDHIWGERYGQVADPFGHIWALSMPVATSRGRKPRSRRGTGVRVEGGLAPQPE